MPLDIPKCSTPNVKLFLLPKKKPMLKSDNSDTKFL